jgi:hypothetical protein
MTTGEFRSVPIDIIWVNQDERQRSKLDGVDRIAGSVRKRGGFINPPLITRDYRLEARRKRSEESEIRGDSLITDPGVVILCNLHNPHPRPYGRRGARSTWGP